MIHYPTTEDLPALASDLGVEPVRDLGLLDSSAHRPTTSIFGRDADETIDEKAAVPLESVVDNHSLIDRNKRLGWLAIVVFYGMNDLTLEAPDDDAFDLVTAVASGRMDYHVVAGTLRSGVSGGR